MRFEYGGEVFEMDKDFEAKHCIEELHDYLSWLQYAISEKEEKREQLKSRLRPRHKEYNPIYRDMMEQGLV
jgi:hypothetical protein